MNKLAIPALLLGVVMIAGAFAFMPVQEASTVHTSAAGQGISTVTFTDTDWNDVAAEDVITYTCDAPALVQSISVAYGANYEAADTIDIDYDIDGVGADFAVVALDDDYTEANIPADNTNVLDLLDGTAQDIDGFAATGATSVLPLLAGGTIAFELANQNADGADESITLTFIAITSGTCSITAG